MGLRERLSDFLHSFGISGAPAHETAATKAGVDVVLSLTAEEPLLIGTLSCEAGEYTFTYSEVFKHRPEVPTIGAFPDRNRVYRSRELWPFFQVRIPPVDRPDVRQLLEEKKLDRSDLMSLLPALGGRAVTSPYDLVPHGSRA
jgi:HipA-like protein